MSNVVTYKKSRWYPSRKLCIKNRVIKMKSTDFVVVFLATILSHGQILPSGYIFLMLNISLKRFLIILNEILISDYSPHSQKKRR